MDGCTNGDRVDEVRVGHVWQVVVLVAPCRRQGALFPTRFFRFRVNLTGIFSSVTKRPFLTELFSSVRSLPGLFGNKIPERHVATSYQNLIRLLQVALSERSKHFCFGFVVLVHGWLVGQRSVLFKICGSSSLVSAQQSSKMVPFSGYRHVPSGMVLPKQTHHSSLTTRKFSSVTT